jgi:hypothetical protein
MCTLLLASRLWFGYFLLVTCCCQYSCAGLILYYTLLLFWACDCVHRQCCTQCDDDYYHYTRSYCNDTTAVQADARHCCASRCCWYCCLYYSGTRCKLRAQYNTYCTYVAPQQYSASSVCHSVAHVQAQYLVSQRIGTYTVGPLVLVQYCCCCLQYAFTATLTLVVHVRVHKRKCCLAQALVLTL